jgi:hypothetical protein
MHHVAMVGKPEGTVSETMEGILSLASGFV